MFRSVTLAAVAALSLALPAFAEGPIAIEDAHARASGPTAIAGAAFMLIRNAGPEDDRLVAVASDIAERVELHTHLMDAQGVARMIEVEDGFVIPAGGVHALARGGDHVMFMGLRRPMVEGGTVSVTLTFEKAGEITLEIPVAPGRGPAEGHGGHGMGG